MAESEVILFTDGACRGNPGPGGWAYILRHRASGKEIERAGGDAHTTNNRMELQAAIEGLKALKRATSVLIVTDSQYVMKGVTEWMDGWKKKGWRRGPKKEPVKNAELWQRLDELVNQHHVTWEYVAGHSGHPENERCDELAVAAAEAMR